MLQALNGNAAPATSPGTGQPDPFGDVLKGLGTPGPAPTPDAGATPDIGSATANARLSPTINDDSQLVLRIIRSLNAQAPGKPIRPDDIGSQAGLSYKRLVNALLIQRQSGWIQVDFSGQKDGLPRPTAVRLLK